MQKIENVHPVTVYLLIYVLHMCATITDWLFKGRFIINDNGYKFIFQKISLVNIWFLQAFQLVQPRTHHLFPPPPCALPLSKRQSQPHNPPKTSFFSFVNLVNYHSSFSTKQNNIFLNSLGSGGVQTFGIAGPHWKKSCLRPHLKYIATQSQKTFIMF